MPPHSSRPRIVKSLDADLDLEFLFDYIARNSGLDRAEAILRRIDGTIDLLAELPGIGRVRSDLAGSPSAFSVWPWLIVYESLSTGDGIFILRVIDGRRDVPRHLRERT